MRTMAVGGHRTLVLGCMTVLLACSAGTESGARNLGPGSTGGMPLGNATGGRAGGMQPLAGTPGPLAGTPGPAGAGAGGVSSRPDVNTVGDECGTKVSAPPPAVGQVDIVWVVDASGSMLDEQQAIGENITQFANDITAADVDVRIAMLTTSAAIPVICPIVDPDPAANTALNGDARYTFLNTRVESNNALDVAIDNFSQYQGVLRPGAATHFVFVTDDESRYKGMASAQDRAAAFTEDMTALLGHTFFVHTISSEGPVPCNNPNCAPDLNTGICVFVMLGCGAAAPGDTYWQLAADTGGLTSSICQQDWSAIFAPLTEAIVQSVPLPCNYPIPEPPPGMTFNRDMVNVTFTAPEATDTAVWPRADSEQACGDNAAWYFNISGNMPQEVRLCPRACQTAESGGALDLSFGCEAVVLE